MQLIKNEHYNGDDISKFAENGNQTIGMKTTAKEFRQPGETLEVYIRASFDKDNYDNKLIGDVFHYHMQDNDGTRDPKGIEVNNILAERAAAHIFLQTGKTGKKYKYIGYKKLIRPADFAKRYFDFKVEPESFNESLLLRNAVLKKNRKKISKSLELSENENNIVKKYGFGAPEQVAEVVFDYFSELAIPEETYEEGNINHAIVKIRKRNRKLRDRVIKERGKTCEICGLDLADKYLEKAVPHVHHKKPLFFTGKVQNGFDDVVVVCPSCHAAIHKNPKKPMSVDELKEMVGTFRF